LPLWKVDDVHDFAFPPLGRAALYFGEEVVKGFCPEPSPPRRGFACLGHRSRSLLGKPIDLCFRHEGAPTDPNEFDLPGGGKRVQMTSRYLQRVAGVIDAACELLFGPNCLTQSPFR